MLVILKIACCIRAKVASERCISHLIIPGLMLFSKYNTCKYIFNWLFFYFRCLSAPTVRKHYLYGCDKGEKHYPKVHVNVFNCLVLSESPKTKYMTLTVVYNKNKEKHPIRNSLLRGWNQRMVEQKKWWKTNNID